MGTHQRSLEVRLHTNGTYEIRTPNGTSTTTDPKVVRTRIREAVASRRPAGTTHQVRLVEPNGTTRRIVFTARGPRLVPSAQPERWYQNMIAAMAELTTPPEKTRPATHTPTAPTTTSTKVATTQADTNTTAATRTNAAHNTAPRTKEGAKPDHDTTRLRLSPLFDIPEPPSRTGPPSTGTRPSSPTPTPPASSPPGPPPATPTDRAPLIPASVREEHGHVDTALDTLFTYALPLLGALGLPAVGAAISPAVQEHGASWFGIFTATLALSAGIGLIVFLYKAGITTNIGGWGHLILSGLILAGSSILATALGLGALDQPLPCQRGAGVIETADVLCGDFRRTAVAYIAQAVITFGPTGALLGAGAGALGGAWLARITTQTH